MDRHLMNLEIIRITRDLVINEYADIRAELHNNWLYESDVLLRTKGLRLAYPSIPPYPTESDIVARAKILMDFLMNANYQQPPMLESSPGSSIDTSENVVVPFRKASIDPPSETILKLVPNLDPESIIETIIEPKPEPIIEPEPEPIIEPEPEPEPIIEPEPEPIIEPEPEPIIESNPNPIVETELDPIVDQDQEVKDYSNTIGKILPSVRKKIDEMKKDWEKK